jgi:2-polyprenyl-3-methyl-5-hydroxy-6-metoxy-1,4-benzoquinol methylase
VVAVDVDPGMLRYIHHRSLADGVKNVEVRLAPADDPSVPTEADIVFACDVLHHVKGLDAWLGALFAETRPGAKLVLVEFKEGELPEGPPASVKIPRAELLKKVTGAGFRLVAERADLLPYQTFLTFERP